MSYLLLFAAAEAVAPATTDDGIVGRFQEIGEQFGWSMPQFLSQAFVFIILAWVLKKYAFGPILAVLDERRAKIKESLENSEKIKKELAAAEATRKEIIQKANEQATAFIEEAQKAAAIQGERRLKEAIARAEDIIKKAREATTFEHDRMLSELKQEVARLVIETTAKVIGKVLTPEDQNRLNEESIRQIAGQN